MGIALSLAIYAPGAGGVPSTATPVMDLRQITSYEHTTTARTGFESLRVGFVDTTEGALDWLRSGLMRSVIAYGPHGEIVWEGYLAAIDAMFGQETRSVSLDGMANRIRTRFTTVNGIAGTTTPASDAASIALYGTKDSVLSLPETTSTAASNLAATDLARRKNPVMQPTTEVATGGLGGVQVTLLFAGWYDTLDWLLTSNATTSTAVTTTQVGTLLSTAASTNAFISTTTTNITASGVSDTQYIGTDTTIRQAIEQLLNQGNSSNQRFAWGVYEHRTMHVEQWAGANPAVVHYRRHLPSGQLYDDDGAIVHPWNARPNRMYEAVDLLDPAPVSTAQDAAARFFVERVTCSISGDRIGVRLEPQTSDALDARLARLG